MKTRAPSLLWIQISPVLTLTGQFQVDCLENVLKEIQIGKKFFLPVSSPYKRVSNAKKHNFDLFRQEKNEVGASFLSSRFLKNKTTKLV